LLEAAARGLSRYGYGNLVLEQVAREAGYTRGALYHQFKDKEDLALAVLEWVDETWWREVGGLVDEQPDPVSALIALARGRDRADLKDPGQALRPPDQRGTKGRVDSTRPARQGGCAGVLGSAGRRRDRARWASTARRAAGRPHRRGRARASQSARPQPT